MHVPTLLVALASGAVASASVSTRPSLAASPYTPGVGFPTPANRTGKVCSVQTHGDGATDDSAYVLAAYHDCNNGGHVVFEKNATYVIGTAMDWTFLRHIDIDIQGTILFTNNMTYWQENSFKFIFQNVTTFFKLGGDDVWIYGGGELNGNGQVWYDEYAADAYILRPVLIGIDGLTNSVVADLNLRYSPQYYVFMANSTSVVFDGIDISGYSQSSHDAKNTDGWDTYRSSDITIQNSVINNGDDCVSFKPNSTDIIVQSLWCNGSHGISVGSLGQYAGEYDIVENIMASNISLHNASDGARIKVWPNSQAALSGDLQGGGGSGHVRNVTFEDFVIDNVAYAIEITQCYGQKNLTLCQAYPSQLTIEDITFRNFTGTTSKKYQPLVAAFACSSDSVCGDIYASDINVVSPNGTSDAFCLNQDEANLEGVTCTSNYLGFN